MSPPGRGFHVRARIIRSRLPWIFGAPTMCSCSAAADVLTGAYPEAEYFDDLVKVTGGQTDERLARLAIRHTATCRDWMREHGVRFQPSLGGTLHLSRTNAFFLGGGKALVNAYYDAAEKLGVAIAYDTEAIDLELSGATFQAAVL